MGLRQKNAKLYLIAVGATALATGVFWLLRTHVDKGQASLLYLPVVIGCAIYLGFGPSVSAAVISFICWDYFFLPPYGGLTVADPKDWLSLLIFLSAAVTTARLASRAQEQAAQAKAREEEIAVLFQASETISREIGSLHVVSALSGQLRSLCQVSKCIVWRAWTPSSDSIGLIPIVTDENAVPDGSQFRSLAESAARNNQIIGFDAASRALWDKALGEPNELTDAFVPLQTEKQIVGVLQVGPKLDGKLFSELDQRLIMTLANHVAVVLARESLAEQAAQAAALREADQLKDSLLSMVSHELRSPLSAIKATATGLLSQESHPDNTRIELQAINAEADRLSVIVGNLLDLSRLEAGAWRPEKDGCDAGEIVATALDRLPSADANRVEINIASDIPLIEADYTQIALVIENLLQNALKYAGRDKPIDLSIEAEYNNSSKDVCGIVIRIRDYGAGIFPGDQDRIFTRFYRSAVHQKSGVGGTGLGLALCQSIVQAHGGRIWASNSPASELSGAVFSLFLPV